MLNCRVFSFYQLRNEGNERGKAIPGFPYLPFKSEPHPPLHLEKEPQAFSPFRFKGSDSSCWNLSLVCSIHCPPPTSPSPNGLACCPLQKSQKISSTAWLRMCSPVASGLHRYLFPLSRQIKDHRFLFGLTGVVGLHGFLLWWCSLEGRGSSSAMESPAKCQW